MVRRGPVSYTHLGLEKADERHPDGEGGVQRLVPQGVHAEHDAGAAAEEGHEKERRFRYPPAAALGAGLVHGHQGKAVAVYKEQVGPQERCV